MRIHECPFCKGKVQFKKVECQQCGVSFEGDLYTSPLTGLSEDQQKFIELFILNSGSLKAMARILEVTYPTVRSKLNHIIDKLTTEIQKESHNHGKAE